MLTALREAPCPEGKPLLTALRDAPGRPEGKPC